GGLGTDCDSDVIDVSDDESDDVGDAGVDSVDKLDWAEISGDCRIQMNDFAPSVTLPGVNHNLDPDDSPLDYFYLFLKKYFFEELVVQINSYAEQERTRATARGHPHKTFWTPTTLSEMKVWIGINI